MNSKNSKGFSIIELLLVIAIIGVIAAIVVPNYLAYRRDANGAAAMKSLTSIAVVQEDYKGTVGKGAYAKSLNSLYHDYIVPYGLTDFYDAELFSGNKDGYHFEIVDAGKDQWGFAHYGLYAMPAKTSGVLQSGRCRLGSDETGITRGDPDLSVAPNTRAAIDAMVAFGLKENRCHD